VDLKNSVGAPLLLCVIFPLKSRTLHQEGLPAVDFR